MTSVDGAVDTGTPRKPDAIAVAARIFGWAMLFCLPAFVFNNFLLGPDLEALKEQMKDPMPADAYRSFAQSTCPRCRHERYPQGPQREPPGFARQEAGP